MSESRDLTSHLLSLSTDTPYSAAIAHPFLTSAGDGTLDDSLLALWLAQDRIYAAHAYPSLIGSLIASIPWNKSHKIDSPEEAMNQRTLRVLVFCLENIVKEIEFFKDTATKWGLDMEAWKESKGTRDYTAEMTRISKSGRLEDGLVFLWAMEKVYLDAWSAVHNRLLKTASARSDADVTHSAVMSFAANWSCSEFLSFVDELANVVNNLGIVPGSRECRRAEDIWARVIELEAAFWPTEGDQAHMKKIL